MCLFKKNHNHEVLKIHQKLGIKYALQDKKMHPYYKYKKINTNLFENYLKNVYFKSKRFG